MGTTKAKTASRARQVDIISHWAKLIEGMQMSTQDFYARVEQILTDRMIPGLVMSRVLWKEGGMLSARREYLRMVRERLTFDVCAAPFGTGFFVSSWFGEKPLQFGFLAFYVALIALATLADFAFAPIGIMARIQMFYGSNAVALTLMSLVSVAAIMIIIYFGQDLDRVLIRVPVVGFLYERFFRSITYYRIDAACMYQQAVHDAVIQVISEVSEAQGLAPMSELDRRPVFTDLLTPRHPHGRR